MNIEEDVPPNNLFIDPFDLNSVRKEMSKAKIMKVLEKLQPENLKKKSDLDLSRIESESEWKSNPTKYEQEIIDLLNNAGKRVIIQADCAGGGKTYAGMLHLTMKQKEGKKVLAVAPTNKRVKDLKEKIGDANAMTLHKLLKMGVGKENEDKKSNDKSRSILPDIDVLLIDEIYAFPVKLLGKIKSQIVDKYPNMQIIATGDVHQSRVADIHNCDVDAYYSQVVASMFPSGILLQLNKRMASKEDSDKIALIKNAVMEGKSIPFIKKFNAISHLLERHIQEDGTFTGVALCYHHDTKFAVSQLIHAAIVSHQANKDNEYVDVEGFKLCVGMEMVNRIWTKARGKVMNVNDNFRITRIYDYIKSVENDDDDLIDEITQKAVEMIDETTGELFVVKQEHLCHFEYPYCWTIHSSQGDTYENCPISCFDFDAYWINKNDKYTAMSRTNRVECVEIYDGDSFKLDPRGPKVREALPHQQLKETIERRILSHKHADNKAQREFDDETYINVEWVMEKLGSQNMKCAHHDCACDLTIAIDTENPREKKSNFSVDRKDNRFAHTKENCVISCRNCNNKRKQLISL